MLNKINRILFICVALLFVTSLLSCGNNKTACNYHISTLLEAQKDEALQPFENTIGYMFNTDTMDYLIPSYELAVKGEIKHKLNNSVKIFSRKALYQKETQEVLFDDMQDGKYIMLICDTLNKIYSYKQQEILAGAKEVVVKVVFYPYKFETNPDTVFTSNKWIQKK